MDADGAPGLVQLSPMARVYDPESLVKNLKDFRREFGDAVGRELSQEEIADAAGIRVDTYRSWESGRRRPETDGLIPLARLYGRIVEDFYDPTPPPPDASRRAVPLVRFKADGLDSDLLAEVQAQIERVKRLQVDRIRQAQERARKGKKL